MIVGIIDVGSNTIRLSIYKTEQKKITLLLHKKTMAGLIGFVKNGEMRQKGIRRACEVLCLYQHILSNFEIDEIYVFATASLRNITNTEEAVAAIYQLTGLRVEVLSGIEEAELDFFGAVHDAELTEGILIDIGGGSTELVPFQDGKMLQAMSIPVGSLAMYRKYVKKLLPKEKECTDIRKAVSKQLEDLSFLEGTHYPVICGVGGTIRATGKLYNDRFELDVQNKEMKAGGIRKVLEELSGTGRETCDKILQIVPDRVHILKPGMVILETLMDAFQSEQVVISRYGVREGYLLKKMKV
jgi:hypothetical protein